MYGVTPTALEVLIYVIFMDPLTALNHLLNFAAPALVLAMVLVPGSRVL